LGFKLYDEIFDYSYDSNTDTEERIVDMVKNLNQYKHADLYELYNRIKEITVFNKKKSLDYYENDPYIPNDLITLYKNHPHEFIDNKFIKMECDLQDIFKNKI
jgi:hypothetical protein